MGRYVLYAVYVMLAATLLAGCGNRNNEVKDVLETESDTPGVGQHRLGFDPDTLSVFEGKVRRNEFFSNLLMRLGLEAQQAYGLSMACDTVFDVRKLRSGNAFKAYYRDSVPEAAGSRELKSIPKDMELEYLVYEKDAMTDVVFGCRRPYRVWVSEKGMPTVHLTRQGDTLTIRQEDPWGRGLVWEQPLSLLSIGDAGADTLHLRIDRPEISLPLPTGTRYLIPNSDALAYRCSDARNYMHRATHIYP